MPTKRSRITGTYADDGVMNQLRRPSELLIGTQTALAAVEAERARKQGILTLPPPENIDRKVPENFLDKCWFCQKKFQKDKDIFMYSQFRAFCTWKCRQMVIDMDSMREKADRLSAQKKAQKAQSNKMKNVVDHQQGY